MELRKEILTLIEAERTKQEAKWGEQQHLHGTWTLILMEEIGEASEAMLKGRQTEAVFELVQAAAVIVAWLEDALGHNETLAEEVFESRPQRRISTTAPDHAMKLDAALKSRRAGELRH